MVHAKPLSLSLYPSLSLSSPLSHCLFLSLTHSLSFENKRGLNKYTQTKKGTWWIKTYIHSFIHLLTVGLSPCVLSRPGGIWKICG